MAEGRYIFWVTPGLGYALACDPDGTESVEIWFRCGPAAPDDIDDIDTELAQRALDNQP